jgi:hypothetical protein
MGLKFTPSRDGVERCTLHVHLRATPEELALYRRWAKRHNQTVNDWIDSALARGLTDACEIEREMDEDEEQE